MKKKISKKPIKKKADKIIKKKVKKRPNGRPTLYTEKLGKNICERIASGEYLIHICQEEKMPHEATVFRWLYKNKEFCELYTRSRITWAEKQFEIMMVIADTPEMGIQERDTPKGKIVIKGDMTEHRKLQVSTRKWVLEKLNGRYGNKLKLETADEDDGRPTRDMTIEEIQQFYSKIIK